MNPKLIDNYLKILHEELEIATGCTEPIAIAYCGAKAREVLGHKPERINIKVSGNILKNAMGVIIPHTNLRGVVASAILGIIGGCADKKLEVLTTLKEEDIVEAVKLLKTGYANLEIIDSPIKLYIEISAYKDSNYATVIIKHTHTNITTIIKNSQTIYHNECDEDLATLSSIDHNLLNVHDIYEFAKTVDLQSICDILNAQIDYNFAIARKGLEANFGLNVGATWLKYSKHDDYVRLAKAYTAAASDARMSGATLPVVTNSGSGNQGITASIPLIIYAKHKNSSTDELYRALILSDLIAIHIKTKLGRLSAFCGVVVAATGASCGISLLDGANITQIEDTIKNILADISGVYCDGAKPTCASKIASSVDAAFQASMLAMNNHRIEYDSGIINDDIEQTIINVGEIGQITETDKKIIEIMQKSCM